MRNQLSILLIAICIITIFSCKKSDDKNTTPAAKTTAVTPYGHFYTTINDGLVLITDSLFNPVDTYLYGYNSEIMVLMHSNPSNPLDPSLDADSILLNGLPLEKSLEDDTNAYFNFGGDFHNFYIENGTNWWVKGKGTVPAMAYNDSKKNPDFTGHIPTITERANGLTFTFDASTVFNADSVRVIYNYDSVTQQGVSRTFAANAGTVTISRKDLEPLDPKTHIVTVVPFSYTIQYFGGNPYAFIREKEIDRGSIGY